MPGRGPALDVLPEATGLPRPERVRVAVVDGQFFDAQVGKRVPQEGFAAKTVWGWIAWALAGRKVSSRQLGRQRENGSAAARHDAQRFE